MADSFFEESKVEEQAQEQITETIKLGEKEYSQDDLQKLVGLGEIAQELETKWNTKIDKVYPEFTKTRQELAEMRQQAEQQAQQKIEQKEQAGEELSETERAELVKKELKKYGVMTEEDFEQKYAQRRSGEKLLDYTETVVTKAVAEGKPKTNTEDLLTYMAETGIRDPQVAYEVMFKNQIKELETQKLNSLRPQGIYTDGSSTAGAKNPTPIQVTKANLGSLLEEVLTRTGQ